MLSNDAAADHSLLTMAREFFQVDLIGKYDLK
jgi:hypothetical protein